jgi:diketogulonate reductase-like aldo/keto reductase
MPGILYGTAWKKERTANLVEQAIGLGFRGIDTACQPKHYHEPGVGAGLSAAYHQTGLCRPDLYLQSKFTPAKGQDPARMPYDAESSLSLQVAQSFATSLKNLRTDYLDGLLLHSPLADEDDLLEVWRAMEEIQQSGGVRQLGISNCYALEQLQWLYEQAHIKPAVVQNRFYDETGYDREIRAFCALHGMVYQSFWSLTANPQILAHDTLKALATQYQRTPAQVFFRFLTQMHILPLTGTTSETHMREDLAIFDFQLVPAEVDAIENLLDPI